MCLQHTYKYKYKYCWQGLYTIHTPVHTLFMVAHHHNKTIKTTDTHSLSLCEQLSPFSPPTCWAGPLNMISLTTTTGSALVLSSDTVNPNPISSS